MVTGDRISSLFGFFFALYILKQGFGLEMGGLHQPGPGFFPVFGGVFLGIFSMVLFVRSLLSQPGKKGREAEGEKDNPRFVLYVFIGLMLYAFIFEWLGFILSTFLLAAFFLGFFDPQKWWKLLLTAAVASSSSYIIFSVLLKSDLPKGILERFL
jgi:putative tricarboxylic transport membrane protein